MTPPGRARGAADSKRMEKLAAGLSLTVQRATRLPGLPSAARIRKWVLAALVGADYRRAAELNVRLVNAAEGRRLNHRWRGKDCATNVLSFPAAVPEGVPVRLLGDLVICAPVVRREVQEQGKGLEAHWAHLVIHGVLHLLGYDHEAPDEARTMEALEVSVLAALGYPDPYAAPVVDS